MEIIKAREKLSSLDVISFPHQKPRARNKMLRKLNKLANLLGEAKKLSLDEAFKALGSKING